MSPYSLSFAFVSPSSSSHVMTIDGNPMPLIGIGSIVIPHLSLPNIYLISKLILNLTSVG
jgi:hypothetical protein